MWWLIWTGQVVERRLGSAAFAACYVLCALGGSLTSTLWQPTAISVGASGAVWGVWGLVVTLLIYDRQAGSSPSLPPMFFFVALAVASDLCTSWLRPHIDSGAHVGGFLTGVACGLMTSMASRRHGRDQHSPDKPARYRLCEPGML